MPQKNLLVLLIDIEVSCLTPRRRAHVDGQNAITERGRDRGRRRAGGGEFEKRDPKNVEPPGLAEPLEPDAHPRPEKRLQLAAHLEQADRVAQLVKHLVQPQLAVVVGPVVQVEIDRQGDSAVDARSRKADVNARPGANRTDQGNFGNVPSRGIEVVDEHAADQVDRGSRAGLLPHERLADPESVVAHREAALERRRPFDEHAHRYRPDRDAAVRNPQRRHRHHLARVETHQRDVLTHQQAEDLAGILQKWEREARGRFAQALVRARLSHALLQHLLPLRVGNLDELPRLVRGGLLLERLVLVDLERTTGVRVRGVGPWWQ